MSRLEGFSATLRQRPFWNSRYIPRLFGEPSHHKVISQQTIIGMFPDILETFKLPGFVPLFNDIILINALGGQLDIFQNLFSTEVGGLKKTQ